MVEPHFTEDELNEEFSNTTTLTDLPEIDEWDEDDFNDITGFDYGLLDD
jgi:hypothetical protein